MHVLDVLLLCLDYYNTTHRKKNCKKKPRRNAAGITLFLFSPKDNIFFRTVNHIAADINRNQESRRNAAGHLYLVCVKAVEAY